MKDNSFLSRKLIRAGFIADTFKPAAAIEKLYGDQRYEQAMCEAIKKILADAEIKNGAPMMTHPFIDAYIDSADGSTATNNHYYYTSRSHAYV